MRDKQVKDEGKRKKVEKKKESELDKLLVEKIKEEIIPLALEFYMDVIEQDEMGDEDEDEGDDDDDEDEPKEKKKKPKGGAGKAGDKEECKQQ